MTEAITKCIAPNCEVDAALDSPLCPYHKHKLQRAEASILGDATRVIRAEMRQFERLVYHRDTVTLEGIVDQPRLLTAADIAHRIVWPIDKVKRMLRKFREDQYRG